MPFERMNSSTKLQLNVYFNTKFCFFMLKTFFIILKHSIIKDICAFSLCGKDSFPKIKDSKTRWHSREKDNLVRDYNPKVN